MKSQATSISVRPSLPRLRSCALAAAAAATLWPTGTWMATALAQTSAAGSSQPINVEGGGSLIPYQYVPSPRWTPPASAPGGSDAPKRPASQQKIFDAYQAGNYGLAASEGYALIQQTKVDDELRFYVGNSLAWTGQLQQGIEVYKSLLTTAYRTQAQLGLGNVYRWQNIDHLAFAEYADVLRSKPKDPDAIQGMRLLQRELRPRTTITAGGTRDSSDTESRSVVLNHRWRDASMANVWEVETGVFQTENPALLVRQGDAAVRYKAMDRSFRPQVELSTNGKTVFGNLAVEVGGLPLVMDIGRVNWARISNNANGLANGITANRVGVRGTKAFSLGAVNARFDVSKVSDGNTVTTSAIRYWPSMRPLGQHFKPVLSVETRHVSFATPNYWSPATGYAAFNAGVLAEWSEPDWYFYTSLQRGWRITGEAGQSWSGSIAAKRWVTQDIALGASFWAMGSRRDGVPYRARSAYFTAERLWD